ncbi:hypothetical protein [Bombilactobacillus bombi]|uniref:hypothetical protein n=1 Tax=Bombilactobacillus bombi TaxID=1303590 RepID=UPI0015E5DCE0|nr:hypothetical protein [Bombilactobacillus bombi]MBA1434664.1 hypothetical protein [Bombilactobacillus bombi]
MRSRIIKYLIISMLFLLISIYYTFLFASHGTIRLLDSYDMLFHWNRISSLDNIITSPTNFNYWGQVGNFTNVFYPWLTMLPGFIIFKLVGSPFSGFLVFLTLITFLTLLSSYYFMNKFVHNTLQALLFAVIYTLSFFRLASVLYRSGVAEYTCYIFIPMLFYAFARLLQGKFAAWPLLALAMSLIILTHPLTGFCSIVMMLVLLFLILFVHVAHHWRYWGELLVAGLKAVLVVTITCIGLFIPMLEQMRFQPINRPVIMNLAQMAQDPLTLWQNTWTTDVRSYSIGIAALIAVLLIAIFIWWDKPVYRLVGIAAIIALILSTKIIPWQYFQNTFMNYLQFPWRFLNLATFFLAIYLSHILTQIVKNVSPLWQLLVLVLTLAGFSIQAAISVQQFNQQPHPKTIITVQNVQTKVSKFTQTDYYPQKSLFFKKDLKHHYFVVDGQKTKLPFTTTDNSYMVKYYNKTTSVIDLPILFYKGVQVQINNVTVPTKSSYRGTVLIYTQAGENNIVVTYHYPFISRLALIISFAGLIILILLILNHKWQIFVYLSKMYRQ